MFGFFSSHNIFWLSISLRPSVFSLCLQQDCFRSNIRESPSGGFDSHRGWLWGKSPDLVSAMVVVLAFSVASLLCLCVVRCYMVVLDEDHYAASQEMRAVLCGWCACSENQPSLPYLFAQAYVRDSH